MADKKISALTAASTPLAGTEVLPVVQSGSTVKVSVENLTAGRTVAAQNLDVSMPYFDPTVPPKIRTGSSSADPILEWDRWTGVGTNYNGARFIYDGTIFSFGNAPSAALGSLSFTTRLEINATGDVKANTGNVVIGTAGKGIDFSANGGAAGMTSELLTWYEEGDWTPNQGAGLTVVGAFSSSGKYTRIGRQVTVTGQVNGATSVLVSASGVISTNLPFTSGVNTLGIATNSALSVVGGVFVSSGTTNLSATVAIGATSTIYFQVTYFV